MSEPDRTAMVAAMLTARRSGRISWKRVAALAAQHGVTIKPDAARKAWQRMVARDEAARKRAAKPRYDGSPTSVVVLDSQGEKGGVDLSPHGAVNAVEQFRAKLAAGKAKLPKAGG